MNEEEYIPLDHDCSILSPLMNLSWIFLILSLIQLNTQKTMFICCVLSVQAHHYFALKKDLCINSPSLFSTGSVSLHLFYPEAKNPTIILNSLTIWLAFREITTDREFSFRKLKKHANSLKFSADSAWE